jgi:1-phosphofructokinase
MPETPDTRSAPPGTPKLKSDEPDYPGLEAWWREASATREHGRASDRLSLSGDKPALFLTGTDANEISTPSLAATDPGRRRLDVRRHRRRARVGCLGIVDAVRVGAAAGALNVTGRGKGTGDRQQIERLARHDDALRTDAGGLARPASETWSPGLQS